MKRSWLMLAAVLAVGCGGEDGAAAFEFTPGPAGRAVGLYAVVEAAQGSIESNEVEIVLLAEGEDPLGMESEADAEPRMAELAEPTAVWANTSVAMDFATDPRPSQRYFDPFELATTPRADVDDCGPGGLATGTVVEEMGTLNGRICYASSTLGVGALLAEGYGKFIIWFSPEGLYYSAELGKNLYFPPDFLHSNFVASTGCFFPPGETMTTEYLAEQRQLAIAASVFGPVGGVGFSFYLNKLEGFARALEADFILQRSIPLTPLLALFPLSMAFQAQTIEFVEPRALMAWDGTCLSPLEQADGDAEFRASSDPLLMMRDRLEQLASNDGSSYRSALGAEMARSFLPMAEVLAERGGGGAAEGLPAGSNGDWFAQFLARDERTLCEDCPSTSADGMIARLARSFAEAEDDGDIFAAGARAVAGGLQGLPQPIRLGAAQSDVLAGVDLGLEFAADAIAERRGDANRYVAQNILVIEPVVGEEAVLDVTAAEVAALIGIPQAALEGATVVFDAGPIVDEGRFEIDGGVATARISPNRGTKLVFRVSVELAGAVGPLPEGAEDWVVRPALRVLRPKAGPPSAVIATAPGAILSGATTNFSATVVDASGTVVRDGVTVRFYDESGELGSAEAIEGTATIRLVPEPDQPVLQQVQVGTVELADGGNAPGLRITGVGVSRDANVEIDGVLHEGPRSVVSSGELLVAVEGLESGEHFVTVTNPHGAPSEPLTFTLE